MGLLLLFVLVMLILLFMLILSVYIHLFSYKTRNYLCSVRRDNNNIPPADFVEAIHRARSFGGDATVLADYALTTRFGN